MTYAQWPYLGVLGVLIACSLGLPIPEDIPLLTGGFLCHRGLARLEYMIPVALLGVLVGDFILFGIGRTLGHHVTERRFVRRLVKPDRLRKAELLFAQHGVKIIFVCRFLPGLRPMMFMASGVLRVPLWKFAAVNGSAACISVPTIVMLGKFFGHNFEKLQQDVRTATHLIALAIVLVGLGIAAVYVYRRQRRLMASVEDDNAAETGLGQVTIRDEKRPASQATRQPNHTESSRESGPAREANTA